MGDSNPLLFVAVSSHHICCQAASPRQCLSQDLGVGWRNSFSLIAFHQEGWPGQGHLWRPGLQGAGCRLFPLGVACWARTRVSWWLVLCSSSRPWATPLTALPGPPARRWQGRAGQLRACPASMTACRPLTVNLRPPLVSLFLLPLPPPRPPPPTPAPSWSKRLSEPLMLENWAPL